MALENALTILDLEPIRRSRNIQHGGHQWRADFGLEQGRNERSEQAEPAQCSCPCCERQIATAKWITEIFNRLRFHPDTHVGEGSIIVNVQVQNEITDLLTDSCAETITDEKETPVEAHA